MLRCIRPETEAIHAAVHLQVDVVRAIGLVRRQHVDLPVVEHLDLRGGCQREGDPEIGIPHRRMVKRRVGSS